MARDWVRKMMTDYRHRSKKKGIAFELDYMQFRALATSPCTYCGVDPALRSSIKVGKSAMSYLAHGIDRVDSSKGYVAGNVQTCCATCNTMKLDLVDEDFRDHIKKIFSKIVGE